MSLLSWMFDWIYPKESGNKEQSILMDLVEAYKLEKKLSSEPLQFDRLLKVQMVIGLLEGDLYDIVGAFVAKSKIEETKLLALKDKLD